jgi:DMSO/TMAO reductase YedYZ heme-binding membrane subunit
VNTAQLTWYVARSGGIVAWALASASVLCGLAISLRLAPKRPWPAWLLDLHRFLGGLAVIFVGIHVGAILLDSYTTIGLTNVLVPFTGTWHPAAVGWGVIAVYVLLAVELTSLARRKVSARLWRRVHYGAFVVLALSTVHALAAGTDAKAGSVLQVAIVSVTTLVIALTTVRIARTGERPDVARRATEAPRPATAHVAPPRRVPLAQAVGTSVPARPDVSLVSDVPLA